MTRHRLPQVPDGALRDIASSPRIERVWARIECELESGASPSRRVVPWAWMPVAFAAVFALGIGVGLSVRPEAPLEVTAIAGERSPSPDRRGDREPVSGNAERRSEGVPSADPEKPRLVLRRAPEPHASVGGVQSVTGSPVLSVPPIAVPKAGPPEWYRRWKDDDLVQARASIEQDGGFEAVLVRASPDQLMAMVDIARSARESGRAVAALRRVVEQFPGDPNAPIAAATLGHMLEKAGDRAGAAKAFELARSLSPKGDLAEDVLVQEIESQLEQGDLQRARDLVDQYAKDFPSGARLAELRTAVGQPAPGQSSGPFAEAASASEVAPGERSAGDRGAVDREGTGGAASTLRGTRAATSVSPAVASAAPSTSAGR